MKHRTVLLNPGPVNVTARVRRALLRPDICHREPEYAALSQSVRDKLTAIFSVKKTHSPAFFSGSGTTAVEALMGSFATPGKEILVLSNGVYGERLKAILELRGTPFRFLSAPAGDFPSMDSVRNALSKKSVEAVALVHHETSSGMLNPLSDVARAARRYGKYVLVDAVSSLGGETLNLPEIDLCAGTSGKCLHGFPGISFVLVSNRVRPLVQNRRGFTLTLDLANALKHTESNDTPFTPAISPLYALDEALSELAKEGLRQRIAAYRKKSGLVMQGMRRLGIKPFIENPESRSHVLSAFWTPEDVSYDTLHDALKKAGFVIYAGQSELRGRIFRVANLGDVQAADLKRFFQALASALKGRS